MRPRLKLLREMPNLYVAACLISPSCSRRDSHCSFCSPPRPVFISELNHPSTMRHCFTLCLERLRRRPAQPPSTSGGNASSTRLCVERERAPCRLAACALSKRLRSASLFRFLGLAISQWPAMPLAPHSPRSRSSSIFLVIHL